LNKTEGVYYKLAVGEWKRPVAISNFSEVQDDPIELITRAILAEEPGVLYGAHEDDARGLAWAVRNRHDSGYYSYTGEKGWYWSASSQVFGKGSTRALDPLNSSYWKNDTDAIAAYNRAHEIAQEVFFADPSDDITGGTGHYMEWTDAKEPPGGGIYEDATMSDGSTVPVCINCIPYERTHFRYAWLENGNYVFSPWQCVNTASVCK